MGAMGDASSAVGEFFMPTSVVGRYIYFLVLGRSSERRAYRSQLVAQVPSSSSGRTALFDGVFARLLSRCFTNIPDDSVIARFLDELLAPISGSVDLDMDVARQLVRRATSGGRVSVPLPGEDELLEIYGVISHLIVRRFAVGDVDVARIIRDAEDALAKHGVELVEHRES